ncbi:hypothetical protein WMY93_013022 [Mugilogobius chulae]|uniref:Uncharacterized protein n=1 Tax=Mugilogobius chulae TaxID=88201 RepID=A0AAW0PB11_9GOBI
MFPPRSRPFQQKERNENDDGGPVTLPVASSLSEKFVENLRIIVIHLLSQQLARSWKEECYGCEHMVCMQPQQGSKEL